MTSPSILLEAKGKKPEIHVASPDTGGMNPVLGVLWVIGTAASWMIVLLALHYFFDRLLGR
jgi:hypothetical protein